MPNTPVFPEICLLDCVEALQAFHTITKVRLFSRDLFRELYKEFNIKNFGPDTILKSMIAFSLLKNHEPALYEYTEIGFLICTSGREANYLQLLRTALLSDHPTGRIFKKLDGKVIHGFEKLKSEIVGFGIDQKKWTEFVGILFVMEKALEF